MVLFRALIFLLLLAAGLMFAAYALTGQAKYKRWGLLTLKWTVFGALAFFAVLILERFR
ncbi:hypothetical protein WG922_00130 [Ramlibacter sp. AN1015]|uniref:hypothetical protein n=1 Tax=Ramlibacter sp. AN1015 TaxID=3133428 RepID=UPI0030BE0D91